MPKFLEDKLKKEYGAKSSTPYKVMNKIGAMRGNKETAKGEDMEKKHEADKKAGKKPSKFVPFKKKSAAAGAEDSGETAPDMEDDEQDPEEMFDDAGEGQETDEPPADEDPVTARKRKQKAAAHKAVRASMKVRDDGDHEYR